MKYVADQKYLHDLMLAFNGVDFQGCLGGDDNHDYVLKKNQVIQGLYIGNISK